MTDTSNFSRHARSGALWGLVLALLGIAAMELMLLAGIRPALPISLPGIAAIAAAGMRGRVAAYAGSLVVTGYFVGNMFLPDRFHGFYSNPVAYMWAVGFVVVIFLAGVLRERADRAAAADRRAAAAEAELATRRVLEERLRESEARFRSLVELSSDWYWEQDAELRLVNVEGANMIANFKKTIGSLRWEHENVADPDDPAWETHKAQLARREAFIGFEYRARDAEGAIRWISVSGRPFQDAHGAFAGYRGTASDVTERKRTEALVREQLYFMSALLEAVPQPVVVKSLEGRYLSVNRAFEAAYGVKSGDILGRRARDIKPGPASEMHERKDAELLASGRETIEYEVETRFADGRLHRMLQHKAIYRQADGSVAGIISLGTDITQRHAAERALRESEARFRDVVDASGGYVWETGPEVAFTYVSDRVLAVLGHPAAEVVGRRPREFMPPGEAERLGRWVLGHGGWDIAFRDVEHRALRRDGVEIWLRVIAVPVRDGTGAIIGYRGTATDITEARNARERIERMNEELEARVADRTADLRASVQELEAFNYTISHDLRAPLRAVNGYAHMAIEDYGTLLPEEGRRLLRTAAESARRMAVMLDALLDFSRLARRAIDRHPVSMQPLVGEVLDELGRDAGGLPVIHVGALPGCTGDPMLLRQVWSNLIGNALKYSRTVAAPRVEIGFEPATGAYFVSDNGVGFDMAHASKLFGVFQRLHTDAQFEGTGVGLAIVQRIVQRHGGRIWAESRPGAGSTFRFTLQAGAAAL